MESSLGALTAPGFSDGTFKHRNQVSVLSKLLLSPFSLSIETDLEVISSVIIVLFLFKEGLIKNVCEKLVFIFSNESILRKSNFIPHRTTNTSRSFAWIT